MYKPARVKTFMMESSFEGADQTAWTSLSLVKFKQ